MTANEVSLDALAVTARDEHGEPVCFRWSCRCGDTVDVTAAELLGGADVLSCASCSLSVRVAFEVDAEP